MIRVVTILTSHAIRFAALALTSALASAQADAAHTSAKLS